MSRQESEEDNAAPPPPILTTPTKASRNDGAGHASSDAEGTEFESDANVEKQFDESKGKKLAYHLFLEYREVMRWKTGSDSVLEPAQIDHEIYTLMKKFMQQSRLMKAPEHKQNAADVGLWKLQRQES